LDDLGAGDGIRQLLLYNIEGLGSSNSLFNKDTLMVFGDCSSSDGAKVMRFMMSA